MSEALKPYISWVTDPDYSGCIVIFAHNVRKARYLAYQQWKGMLDCSPWEILQDLRLQLRDHTWLILAQDSIPHVIDTHPGIYNTWQDYIAHLHWTQAGEDL